jgi:sulfate transport system permease protein
MVDAVVPLPAPDGGSELERTRPRGASWLLVLAAVLYAAVLLFAPLVGLLSGALSKGLTALARALTSKDALHALQLTLLLACAATVLNTVFGVCAAWVLARDTFRGRRFLNALVDTPFAVSPVVAGFMFIVLFGRGGWLEGLARALDVKVVFALPGMLLATTFVSLPFVVREVMPVLHHLGTESEDTARTLGASSWTAFWKVTLPSIRWGLLYGISLTFARAVGEFGAVLVVSGSVTGLTETATLFIFRSLDERDTVAAYGMAFLLALIAFGLIAGIDALRLRTQRPRSPGRAA